MPNCLNFEWKRVPGFTSLEVNPYGLVRVLERINHVAGAGIVDQTRVYSCKILGQSYNEQGYLTVSHEGKKLKVHRLIALTFIDNLEEKSDVNHKDGVKDNNTVMNLEWVTRSENVKHSFNELGRVGSQLGKTGSLHSRAIPVEAFDPITGEVKLSFGSMSDAAVVGFTLSKVSMAVNGKLKTHRGLGWRVSNTVNTQGAKNE